MLRERLSLSLSLSLSLPSLAARNSPALEHADCTVGRWLNAYVSATSRLGRTASDDQRRKAAGRHADHATAVTPVDGLQRGEARPYGYALL